MNKFTKASIISFGFLSIVPPAIMAERQYSMFYEKNNPIAKDWMDKQGVAPKDPKKLVDFEKNIKENFYSMGCHRSIFGGRNYKALKTFDSAKQALTTEFPVKFEFGAQENDPLIACSTASAEANNKYEFELAIKKGGKGFIERISVDATLVKSQIIFYEINPRNRTAPYKYIFGGKRDITKNHKFSDYKTFDPGTNQWIGLDKLCGPNNKCGNQARYYSVWVDDGSGKGLFDTIGIQNNNSKHISFVKKGGEGGVFKYFSKPNNEVSDLNATNNYYSLTVFSKLAEELDKSKGKWQKIEEFCQTYQNSSEKRIPIKAVIRLKEYCYEKIKPAKPKGKK